MLIHHSNTQLVQVCSRVFCVAFGINLLRHLLFTGRDKTVFMTDLTQIPSDSSSILIATEDHPILKVRFEWLKSSSLAQFVDCVGQSISTMGVCVGVNSVVNRHQLGSSIAAVYFFHQYLKESTS